MINDTEPSFVKQPTKDQPLQREPIGEFEQRDLTPSYALELTELLATQGYSVWGHGTPTHDPRSFFDEGVRAKNSHTQSYSTITNISKPVGVPKSGDVTGSLADSTYMHNWPHKRGVGAPRVVLLAIPNPSPEEHVYASQVEDHLIEDGVLPARFVYGFYDPDTNMVTLNPDCQPNSHQRQQELARIKAAVDEIKSRPLPFDNVEPVQQPTNQPKPTAQDEATGDIW